MMSRPPTFLTLNFLRYLYKNQLIEGFTLMILGFEMIAFASASVSLSFAISLSSFAGRAPCPGIPETLLNGNRFYDAG